MSTLPIIGCFFKGGQVGMRSYHLDKRGRGADFSVFYDNHKTALEKLSYLPDIACETTTLIYLATISENQIKSPFTQTQCETFKRSYRADYATKKGLKVGLVAIAVLSLIGALFNYFAILSGLNDEDYAITSLTLTSTAILIAAVVSFILTGNLPDKSSVNANRRQNSISLELTERFDACAIQLLSLHDHPEKKIVAAKIAHDLSFKALGRAFRVYDKGIDNLVINRYLSPLRHARAIVLNLKKPIAIGSAAYKSFLCARKQHMRMDRMAPSEEETKVYPKEEEGVFLRSPTDDRLYWSEEEGVY